MTNIIRITVSDKENKITQISSFSEKKAKYITETNQWEYVMKIILNK